MSKIGLRILIFGATGMVGQGVLRECLKDPDVSAVVTIGRTDAPCQDPKCSALLRQDLFDYTGLETQLSNFDACFYCLGVSAAGLTEQAYRRVSFEMTLAAAQMLARLNPGMIFCYVSGAGTDSSGAGRVMWARVKGQTENALLALPMKAYMLRPGIIQPIGGIRSKTRSYRVFYSLAAPLLPLLRRLFPSQVLTTVQVGTAMLNLAKLGYAKQVLVARDIAAIA